MLNWTPSTHIGNICNIAKKLDFLKQNFRYATVDAKLMAYETLVRPSLEYFV